MSKVISNTNSSNGEDKALSALPNEAYQAEEPDEWFELENLQGGLIRPKNKVGLQRRQARSIALQTLFESDAVNHEPKAVLERHIEVDALDQEVARFARTLVGGVLEHRPRLDEMIANAAPNWPVDQMAKVDKNILRLAIFEILFNNDVPTKAAINEAIELAKSFGSDSSSRFVNGVLGAIVTQQPKDSGQPAV